MLPPVKRRVAGALATSIVAPYVMALQLWIQEIVNFEAGDSYRYLIWLNLDGKVPDTFELFQALFQVLALATYGLAYISPFLFLISCLIAWQTKAPKWAVLKGMLLGGGIVAPALVAEPSLKSFLLSIQGVLSGAICGWVYGLVAFRDQPGADPKPPQSQAHF